MSVPATNPGTAPTAPTPYEYAVIRAVPRVERGEFVNVGVIVYSRDLDVLAARVSVDTARLAALDPDADPDAVRRAAEAVATTCDGGPEAGESGTPTPGERFRWLTAPRSTVVQPGPVHAGMTRDPLGELDRLMQQLVL